MAFSRLYSMSDGEVIYATPISGEFDNIATYLNDCIHQDGSVAMEADLTVGKTSPGVILDATSYGSQKWRIREWKETGPPVISWLLMEYYSGGSWYVMFRLPNDVTASALAAYFECQYAKVSSDNPYVELEGTETSGAQFRLYEDAGTLYLQYYDSAWQDILSVDAATNTLTFVGSVVLPNTTVTEDNLSIVTLYTGTISGSSGAFYESKDLGASGYGNKVFWVKIAYSDADISPGSGCLVATVAQNSSTNHVELHWTGYATSTWSANYTVYSLS